jgi:hypothetical protein
MSTTRGAASTPNLIEPLDRVRHLAGPAALPGAWSEEDIHLWRCRGCQSDHLVSVQLSSSGIALYQATLQEISDGDGCLRRAIHGLQNSLS